MPREWEEEDVEPHNIALQRFGGKGRQVSRWSQNRKIGMLSAARATPHTQAGIGGDGLGPISGVTATNGIGPSSIVRKGVDQA